MYLPFNLENDVTYSAYDLKMFEQCCSETHCSPNRKEILRGPSIYQHLFLTKLTTLSGGFFIK